MLFWVEKARIPASDPHAIAYCMMQVSADCPQSFNKDASSWSLVSATSTLQEKSNTFAFSLSALRTKQGKGSLIHPPGQMGPLPPIPPEVMWKPPAVVLGKDPGTGEHTLHLLLSSVKHWAENICARRRALQPHTFTPTLHKSLLFRIYVSEVKFFPCGILANITSLLSFQVLCKHRCSDTPRRRGSICCTAHVCALFTPLEHQRWLDFRPAWYGSV